MFTQYQRLLLSLTICYCLMCRTPVNSLHCRPKPWYVTSVSFRCQSLYPLSHLNFTHFTQPFANRASNHLYSNNSNRRPQLKELDLQKWAWKTPPRESSSEQSRRQQTCLRHTMDDLVKGAASACNLVQSMLEIEDQRFDVSTTHSFFVWICCSKRAIFPPEFAQSVETFF